MNGILEFQKKQKQKQSIKCGVSNKDQSHHIYLLENKEETRAA